MSAIVRTMPGTTGRNGLPRPSYVYRGTGKDTLTAHLDAALEQALRAPVKKRHNVHADYDGHPRCGAPGSAGGAPVTSIPGEITCRRCLRYDDMELIRERTAARERLAEATAEKFGKAS